MTSGSLLKARFDGGRKGRHGAEKQVGGPTEHGMGGRAVAALFCLHFSPTLLLLCSSSSPGAQSVSLPASIIYIGNTVEILLDILGFNRYTVEQLFLKKDSWKKYSSKKKINSKIVL